MRTLGVALIPALAVALSGCGDSESASSGIGEPLRVTNGTFIEAEFPNTYENGPTVPLVDIRNTEFLAGTANKQVSGVATSTSQSVALSLEGLSRGYWVVPVGSPDLTTAGAFTWNALCDFASSVPAGPQVLNIAALDSAGHFGPIRAQGLNIRSLIPAGHVVATLSWGADVDIDLHIVGPKGKELSPKHPNSSVLDENGMAVAGSGLLDHDSLASCVPDGRRTENVIWTDPPEAGVYLVRADMFNACGKPSAIFKFNLYVDGQSVLEKTGRLLDMDADGGGDGSGLFVTEFICDEGTGTCS